MRKVRIDFLEFARGYAIFTIVLYHAFQKAGLSPLAQQAIGFGGTGVHLFFLLSGYGLALSKPAGLAAFYRRRLLKVWLPYVLALSISLLAAYALHLFPDGWGAWLAGVGLYQMFYAPYVESFGGHFWFISAIVQFYLIYPALVWIKNRLGNPWYFAAAALLASVLWWLVVYGLGKGHLRTWNSFFLQFLWEFALGMVLAETHREGRGFWQFRWWAYLPAGLFFAGLMALMLLRLGEVGRIFNDIPALLGYTALGVFVFRVGEKFLPAVRLFFMWTGRYSFSLYLVHVLVLELYLRLLHFRHPDPGWPWLLPFVPLALLAAWAFEPLSRRWVDGFEKLLRLPAQ